MHSSMHSFIHSLINSFFHSFIIPSFSYSFIQLFLHSFITSFIHSVIPSFINSFIPSFIIYLFIWNKIVWICSSYKKYFREWSRKWRLAWSDRCQKRQVCAYLSNFKFPRICFCHILPGNWNNLHFLRIFRVLPFSARKRIFIMTSQV